MLLLRNSAYTVFLLLVRATCSTILYLNANLKFPIYQHKMQVTPIKLSKFISSPKILNANQKLIRFFTAHYTTLGRCHYTTLGRCHYTTLGRRHYTTLGRCHYTTLGRCRYTTLGRCHYTTLGRCHYTTLGRCHYNVSSPVHSPLQAVSTMDCVLLNLLLTYI